MERQDRVLSQLGLERQPLAERMRELKVPGVNIAVVDGGRVDWAAGFGERELGTGLPVTTETLFQAASISKPVFALAVMKLVSRGVLDLDADANAYLRSWQLPPAGGWQPRVTLRQLLSHSAGLTVHGFPGYRRDAELPALPHILDGAEPANTRPVRADTLPGLHVRYSGGGITVAQLLVEDVTGKPLPETMRELVLDPLGLEYSTYEQPLPARLHDQSAAGHEDGAAVPGKWHVYPEQAAAGLWTTPIELAAIALAVRRAWRGEEASLIPQQAVREMLRPQAPDQSAARGAVGIWYFLMGAAGPYPYYHHTGGNAGFVCNHKFSLASGQGYVMMTNASGAIGLCKEVELAVAREYGWPGYFPETAALAGAYEWDGQGVISVSADGGRLIMDIPGQGQLMLVHTGHGVFMVPETGIMATFDQDGLTLDQNGRQLRAARIWR